MDFLNDNSGRHVLRLSTILTAPDYVKNASILAEDVAELPNGAFALPHKREFPIDEAGHVWLSYGYAKSASVNDALLLGKLKQAGELFGIADDLQAIDDAFSSLVKKASTEREYAVQVDFGPGDETSNEPMKKAGGIRGFYPIGTGFEIESSAIKLANDQQKIPLELFADGCRNLVKAAQAKGVSLDFLPKRVTEYGVERLPSPEVIGHYAELRKQATGDDIYEQIAKAATEDPEQHASHEWAELWLNADRQNGYKVARHEPDPYLIFNSGPTVAEIERQIESWVDIAGAPVPVTKIASIREDTVRKWFSKENADRLVSLVKQAATSTGSDLTAAFRQIDQTLAVNFLKRLLQT